MTAIIVFFICFFASVIGSICGIGGGVIIKPLLDSLSVFPVPTINFLSSCTVLSMATYTVICSKCSRESQIEFHSTSILGVGSAIGGVIGNRTFRIAQVLCATPRQAGAMQAALLVVVLAATLIYTLNKDRIRALHITSSLALLIIGAFLGGVSSFLGIGGGPFNLAFLSFFFSMGTKKAAENSLYIIFFSQLTNLFACVLSQTIPSFIVVYLLLMVCGGIAGGILGRYLNHKLASHTVDILFIGLIICMIFVNMYNFLSFI